MILVVILKTYSFSFEVWIWFDTINSTEKGGLVTVGEFGDSYGIDPNNGEEIWIETYRVLHIMLQQVH